MVNMNIHIYIYIYVIHHLFTIISQYYSDEYHMITHIII